MKRIFLFILLLSIYLFPNDYLFTNNRLFAQQKYILNCNRQLLESSLDTAIAQVGTRERTGHNDGDVEKYLHSVGLSKGNPYCAAGQYYCFYVACLALKLDLSNIPIQRTGLANGIYNNAKNRGYKDKLIPRKHDLIIWRHKNSQNGHIERVYKVMQAGWLITIGFNTSGNNRKNQAEGEGVFIKKRNIYYPLGRMTVRGLVGFNAI